MIAQDMAARKAAEMPIAEAPPKNSWPSAAPERIKTERIQAFRPRPRPIHRLSNIHSHRDIDAILHRECARCERNGHEFSLVVVSVAENDCSRAVARVARLLCRESRATDEIGWYDAGRLCVVLPDTADQGAIAFVRRISESASRGGVSPICNVLGYRGQAHSDNETLSAEQIGKGIEEAGMDLPPNTPHHLRSTRLANAGEVANLLVRPMPWWKRAVDIAGGTLILIAALPIMAGCAIAIKLSDRGPILFRQRRAGLGGRPFTIYKFRTMVTDAEARKSKLMDRSEQDGPAFKIRHDPRITRVGRILRETSLDELPQLFNVLKGDMSLVGPRPLPIEESNRCATWHRRRLDVTPGLTCIWQIRGRSTVSFADWIRMDRRYIRCQSLWQDLKLILLTVPAVFLRRGR
jgi:lipopolysaccharide/colanic/teichoic acid biosynthesis glycosyltransferase